MAFQAELFLPPDSPAIGLTTNKGSVPQRAFSRQDSPNPHSIVVHRERYIAFRRYQVVSVGSSGSHFELSYEQFGKHTQARWFGKAPFSKFCGEILSFGMRHLEEFSWTIDMVAGRTVTRYEFDDSLPSTDALESSVDGALGDMSPRLLRMYSEVLSD